MEHFHAFDIFWNYLMLGLLHSQTLFRKQYEQNNGVITDHSMFTKMNWKGNSAKNNLLIPMHQMRHAFYTGMHI